MPCAGLSRSGTERPARSGARPSPVLRRRRGGVAGLLVRVSSTYPASRTADVGRSEPRCWRQCRSAARQARVERVPAERIARR